MLALRERSQFHTCGTPRNGTSEQSESTPIPRAKQSNRQHKRLTSGTGSLPRFGHSIPQRGAVPNYYSEYSGSGSDLWAWNSCITRRKFSTSVRRPTTSVVESEFRPELHILDPKLVCEAVSGNVVVWCVLPGSTLRDWDNCVSNLWIERIGAFLEYAVNVERWCGFGAGSMTSNLSTSSSCFLRLLLSKTRRTMATETPKTARPPTTPPTIPPIGVLLRLGPDIPVCGTPDSMTELVEMVLLGRLRKGVFRQISRWVVSYVDLREREMGEQAAK